MTAATTATTATTLQRLITGSVLFYSLFCVDVCADLRETTVPIIRPSPLTAVAFFCCFVRTCFVCPFCFCLEFGTSGPIRLHLLGDLRRADRVGCLLGVPVPRDALLHEDDVLQVQDNRVQAGKRPQMLAAFSFFSILSSKCIIHDHSLFFGLASFVCSALHFFFRFLFSAPSPLRRSPSCWPLPNAEPPPRPRPRLQGSA